MKNNIGHDTLEPDVDYESPDGTNRYCIKIDDYYDNIWQEMLEIDGTIIYYQNEFEAVSKVINPILADGIWFYSSIDAEESLCPLDRRREILKMMRRSMNLSKYGITDFQEFKTMIENIDPFAFYVFTEVLYKTNMIIYNGLRNTESLRALEERVDLLK